MLALRRRIDRRSLIRDELDGGAAEVEINEVDRHTQAGVLDPVAHFYFEPEHVDIERGRLFRPIGDDLDMVDAFEHLRLRYSAAWARVTCTELGP